MADRGSGQRTEKPTPKRLREARRKGQIPRSPDLIGWISILVASYLVPAVLGGLRPRFLGYFGQVGEALSAGRLDLALRDTRGLVSGVALVFLPFLAAIVVVTVVGLAAQGGVTPSLEPLRPKLERISPRAGLKRLVSPQSAVDTGKAVVRLAVLALLMWQIMDDQIARFLGGSVRSPTSSGIALAGAVLLLVRLAALLGIVVGVGDYAFQRWRVAKQLRMTKEEVKRENRNTEGDPFIRSRRRSIHARVSRNKMLAAVGEASVVIINPTHISVALSYESGVVPTVLAKGTDELALRIRERAFEAGVPVVESKPLARILDSLTEVGDEVPSQLYEAVAIVIAFVMRLPPTAVSRTVRRVTVPLSALGSDPEVDLGGDPGRRRRRRRGVGAR